MAWTTPKTWAVGDVLTAADMNTYVRDNEDAILPYDVTWQSYSPALTAASSNPTLGTGSSTSGRFYRVGQLCVAHFRVKAGTVGFAAGSGLYRISAPLSAASFMYTANFFRCGTGFFYNSSAPTNYLASFYFVGAGQVEINIDGRGTAQTGADPVVPSNNDEWSGTLTYALA